jgi:hypothetical protein
MAPACGKTAPQETPPAPSVAASPPVAPPPVDHLAPGELIEGTAQAFGLTLPRGLVIEGAFHDLVIASGPVAVHPFVQYLRARLQGGGVREGETSATFDRVQVAAKPGPELRVHIGISPEGVRVEIRDVTPPNIPPAPDEVTRWRRVGLTPDGHLADPSHIE